MFFVLGVVLVHVCRSQIAEKPPEDAKDAQEEKESETGAAAPVAQSNSPDFIINRKNARLGHKWDEGCCKHYKNDRTNY